jgi:Tfp pilus assembly protein PilN
MMMGAPILTITPDSHMQIELLVIIVIGIVALLSGVVLLRVVKRQQQEIKALQEKAEFLTTSLNALCSGAVGVDHRVARLEQRGRDLEHRQDSFETQKQSERPYGEAIQLVHQGASAMRLVEELGLSHNEAELVVMLHGAKSTG